MSSTGERVVPRYIKHPPAGSGWLADGDPWDSGTAHLAHSNASHLAHRNTRLIGHAVLGGDITSASTVDDPWAAAFDVAQPATPDGYTTITWTRFENAVAFGPIALAHNRLGTAPAGFYPRKIRVVTQVFKGPSFGTSLHITAALCAGNDTPFRAARIAGATGHVDDTDVPLLTGGAWTVDYTLEPDAPVRPSATWLSRASGASEPAHVALAPAWLWVGWWTTSAAPVLRDRVESVSAFEIWT